MSPSGHRTKNRLLLAWSNVTAGLAILADIAASDAICCVRLGRYHRGEDHRRATELLQAATPDGRELAIRPGPKLCPAMPLLGSSPRPESFEHFGHGGRLLGGSIIAEALLHGCQVQGGPVGGPVRYPGQYCGESRTGLVRPALVA